MRDGELGDFDLNLLVALDALLSEASVTRAARRLGLTQSAMSHTLRRLRDLLGDPLLVRTPEGMSPTPRARQLGAPLRQALQDIKQAIARPRFDPGSARITFTLCIPDLVQISLLPSLIRRLSQEAPGVDLVVRPLGKSASRRLRAGEFDLVISPLRESKTGFYQQRLFSERFVCLARADHPEVGEALSLERFIRLPHLLVSPLGASAAGLVDRALEEKNLARRVVLRIPSFLAAPLIVAHSDLVLTLPERVARTFSSALPLRILSP